MLTRSHGVVAAADQAERDPVSTHQLVDAVVIPTGLPEFDRVPITGRKRGEEVFEARSIGHRGGS
jgi:hypothetical protein